jgi:LmbE family N-acetylglucosaminyl deacetylase
MGGHRDGALAAGDADALTGEIVDFLREHRPEIVITFGPEGGRNAHRDHRTISRAATAAFFLARLETAYPEQLAAGRTPHAPRRLYYSAWPTPEPGDPLSAHSLPATARVDVRAFREAKREAFLLHVTQRFLQERFERAALVDEEEYALAAGEPQPARLVDDLFAGL